MMEFLLSPGFLALLGTVFGGVGLKVAEKFLNQNTERIAQRIDYRVEIKELYDRIDKLEEEVTAWRTSYYEMQTSMFILRQRLIALGEETT